MTTLLWAAALLVPLLLAAAVPLAGLAPDPVAATTRRTACRAGWLAVLPAGALVVWGDDRPVHAAWLLLGTTLGLDTVGRPLLAVAVVLYGVALASVPRSSTTRPAALTALLLLCFAGNAVVFVAGDVVTFYLAFTVMSFVGYALVVHDRSPGSRRAGSIYLVMTVLGEAAVLSGLLLVARAGGVLVADAPAAVAASADRGLITALLLVGFGVKAGTVPLHVWLPLAHPAAPTPASAVLSGVMVKAGLVGWLRFLPLGEGEPQPGWATVFLLLALLGGFVAVPVGLLQDDPKVVLAYSSISQMGFLAVLVGVALAEPAAAGACTAAAVVHAVHHGLAKGTLFLGVQVWSAERVPRPVVAAVLAVAALSVVGAPLTSGYVAKYGAKQAVGDTTFPLGGSLALADVLPWVGVGSTLLLARFAFVLLARERSPRPSPVARDVAWAVVGVAAVVPVTLLARSLAPPQSVPGLLDAGVWVDQTWPLLLGVVVALAAARVAGRRELAGSRLAHPRGDTVPPGDVVVLEERVVRAAMRAVDRAADRTDRVAGRLRAALARTPSPLPWVGAAQARVGAWQASGAVLLVLVAGGLLWAATKAVAP